MHTYYRTEWQAQNEDTWTTTGSRFSSLKEAKQQLQDDQNYFYSTIKCRIVCVTEGVVLETKGNQQRPR